MSFNCAHGSQRAASIGLENHMLVEASPSGIAMHFEVTTNDIIRH